MLHPQVEQSFEQAQNREDELGIQFEGLLKLGPGAAKVGFEAAQVVGQVPLGGLEPVDPLGEAPQAVFLAGNPTLKGVKAAPQVADGLADLVQQDPVLPQALDGLT